MFNHGQLTRAGLDESQPIANPGGDHDWFMWNSGKTPAGLKAFLGGYKPHPPKAPPSLGSWYTWADN